MVVCLMAIWSFCTTVQTTMVGKIDRRRGCTAAALMRSLWPMPSCQLVATIVTSANITIISTLITIIIIIIMIRITKISVIISIDVVGEELPHRQNPAAPQDVPPNQCFGTPNLPTKITPTKIA